MLGRCNNTQMHTCTSKSVVQYLTYSDSCVSVRSVRKGNKCKLIDRKWSGLPEVMAGTSWWSLSGRDTARAIDNAIRRRLVDVYVHGWKWRPFGYPVTLIVSFWVLLFWSMQFSFESIHVSTHITMKRFPNASVNSPRAYIYHSQTAGGVSRSINTQTEQKWF